jgi:hypothetical protein
MSTSNPTRQLNWLFVNPVNRFNRVCEFSIPGYPADPVIEDLEWVETIWKKFKFRADEYTIRFWTVSNKLSTNFFFQRLTPPPLQPAAPMHLEEAYRDWQHTDMEKSGYTTHQPVKRLSAILGDTWDPDVVHIIVTAEESTEDECLAGALERMNVGPESPLQAIKNRESQVLTPPFQAVLNILRLPQRENPNLPLSFPGRNVEGVRQAAEEF